MTRITKNETEITLDDNIAFNEEIEKLIDEVLEYQICHPVRVYKPDGRCRFSRVPVKRLEVYRQRIEPILVPVGDMTATLYPVFGCRKEDITNDDIDEFMEFILEPIFICRDEDGELYVSP